MSLSQMANDWDQKRESVRFVCFKDVQEVIVLEETHGSVSDLKVQSWNAFHKSFEDLWNVWLEFLHFTGFQNFDQFRNEHDLFWRVGKRPVLDKTVEQEQSERWVFGKEKHGASHEMFMEQVASLDLVQRNDNILEENDMLFSEWDSKPTDDTGKNVKQLRCTIELESLMDQRVEAIVDCLTNHFSSGHKFGIQAMKNVLEVLPFSWLLRVEKFEEFLDERWSDMHFESLDVGAIVHDQL